MKNFLSCEAQKLAPYTPGEQPKDRPFVKLNTNESPFPPSPKVLEALTADEVRNLNLYSDPDCTSLTCAMAEHCKLSPENVIAGNGSDEILAFAFRAFCGAEIPVAYADITYGFYQAQTALFGIPAKLIPLRDDFTLAIEDYLDFPGTVVIANPNAPTGTAIPAAEIRRLLEANPERVVIVDEAYVDFGAESCVPLVREFDNLLVVQTCSKSRSLAGGRVGFGIGGAEIIQALNRVKFSWNPYNVNRLSILAGAAAVKDEEYFRQCTTAIQQNREQAVVTLKRNGFTVLSSQANFVFAKHPNISGENLFQSLKQRGILVRWFNAPRIQDFVRITIGSETQMTALYTAVANILNEI